jgi:hypothetical protein
MRALLPLCLMPAVAFSAHAADAPGPHEHLTSLLHAQAHPQPVHPAQTRSTAARPNVTRPSIPTASHSTLTAPPHTALIPSTPGMRGIHTATAVLGGAPSHAITSKSASINGTNIHARRPF